MLPQHLYSLVPSLSQPYLAGNETATKYKMATESIVSDSPVSSTSYKMKSLETGPKIPCNEKSLDVACKNKDIEKKEQKEDIGLVNNADADSPQGLQIGKEGSVCGKRVRQEDSEEELER